jgi:hypothetical protein
MSWLKISDKDGGVYAKEPDNDPEQIVSVAEIEAEIKELQARIDSVRLIEIPKDASDEVKEAINYKNGMLIATDIAPIQSQLEQKQQFLNELKAI